MRESHLLSSLREETKILTAEAMEDIQKAAQFWE